MTERVQPLDEISKAIALLCKPGDVHELRVPKAGRSRTISGYYSNPEKLAEAVRKLSKNSALPGIYLTINPCVPACLARCAEACKPYAETTTNDGEIACRRWLPVDCDAKRVADVSSTEEEKAAAGESASRILKYLHEEGFAGLILADSGNGWHILIPTDLPNDADSTALCSRFLSALAQKFDTGKAVVDKKLFNASRILKAYGTVARKGSDTRERPHRMSKIVSGGHHAPVARELLEKIAARIKEPPKEEKQSGNIAEKIEEFLEWGNIQHGARMAYKDGLKWQVDCPFNEAHRRPDAVVYRLISGALGFTCSHNSCDGRDWQQFRALVEERKGEKFLLSNSKSATETASKRPDGTRDALIEQIRNAPEWKPTAETPTPQAGAVLRCFRDIAPKPLRWLWRGRIPLGKLVLLIGDPGFGKSLLTVDVTSRVTRGAVFPDGVACEPGSVILLSAEDDAADTIRPRLDAARADVSRVHILEAVRVALKDGSLTEKAFNLETDIADLEGALREHPDVRLVVIDPISAYLGGVDSHSNAEVRGILTPLAALAARFGVAVLCVTHLRKSAGSIARFPRLLLRLPHARCGR